MTILQSVNLLNNHYKVPVKDIENFIKIVIESYIDKVNLNHVNNLLDENIYTQSEEQYYKVDKKALNKILELL